jgi:hypothetical protein
MDYLPRDLQLHVIKNFDMDTRIKTGIIGKLKVPESLIKTLEKIQIPKYDTMNRYGVKFVKKRAFHIVIAWNTLLNEKMVSILHPDHTFDYWISNEDMTHWFNLSI